MRMKKNTTSKYLAQWAEAECAALTHLLTNTPQDWLNSSRDAVIIVPAYDESASWWQNQAQSLEQQKVWWIWIFNAPDNLQDPQAYQRQADAHAHCQQHLTQAVSYENLTVGKLGEHHHVLLVDRFTEAIPHRQGVGLARKIGNDLGLWLIEKGLVRTPWLFNTDADASLPADMLTHPNVTACLKDSKMGAFQYGFQHHPEQADYAESTWCYDQYLRYHYRGLQRASSPYAYTTVGSLLVASAQQYAAVRGFPKQSAGEDFYLLNKIRKLSPVHTLNDPVIHVSGRPSHRVPYGTGPTLSRWQDQDRYSTFVWSPAVYDKLGTLLKTINGNLLNSNKQVDKAVILKSVPPALTQTLDNLGFEAWLNRAKLHTLTSAEQRHQSFHQWFDGLKTQQFIRQQAEELPKICIADAAHC